MISTICKRGHLQLILFDGRFYGEFFKTFLQQMIKYSKKIYLFIDGHLGHKIKMLNDWLVENESRIEVLLSIHSRIKSKRVCNHDVRKKFLVKKTNEQG